jgi:hypothetical protein
MKLSLLVLAVSAMSMSVLRAERAEEVLDEFLSNVQQMEKLSAEDKGKIQNIVETLRQDEDVQDTVITEALRAMYPEYNQAVRGLADIDSEGAMRSLMEFTQSDDPYLAADATFFLARGYIQHEDHESALPLLRMMNSDHRGHTLRQGESLFFQGSAEMATLDRTTALKTFRKFQTLRVRPSRRMRDEVSRMLIDLEQVEEGSLPDVAEHMDFSRRKLGIEDPGVQTQEVQDEIVSMLDVLIEEAQKQEQQQSQSQGQGQGQAQGNQPGQKPGQGGMAIPDPKTNPFNRPDLNAKRSEWDDPRERERRAEALNSLKERFPARYQQLIEQYSLDLQEEDEDE